MEFKRSSGILMPISSLPGGYGIMADDILSGIYAFLLIILFRYCCA